MWGLGHTFMLVIFSLILLYLAIKGRWLYLFWACLSQVPFWFGSLIYFWTNNPSPSVYNLFSNLIVAACLVSHAERLQRQSQDGTAAILISVVFLLMTTLDILHLVPVFYISTFLYFALQEIGHYLALVMCGGYVIFNWNSGIDLHSSSSAKDKDLA